VSSKDVEMRCLRLTVYELDRHKRHVIVGHALFPLRDCDVSDGLATAGGSTVVWKDLERELTEVKVAFHDTDIGTDTDSPDTPTSLRRTRAISSRGCRCRCRGMRP